MLNVITGISLTEILHLLNKTTIEWFSKSQESIKTAINCFDRIVDLRHTLRYLGFSLEGPSWIFGDNLSVVNSSTLPRVKLQKRSHLFNYHRLREAQACVILNFVHMDGKENPADILTTFCSSREGYELLKPLIF